MSDQKPFVDESCPTVSFSAGTQIVTENELSRKLFIIKKGKARVYKMYNNQKIRLAVLGEGEIFGELSFVDAQPRSASVEAVTDLVALVLDGDDANMQMSRLPGWVLPIFRIIFHRFRETDQKLAVLGTMMEFQQRALKNKKVEKIVYTELAKFTETLKNSYVSRKESDSKVGVRSDELYQELDEKLSDRKLGLRVFWQQLEEHGIIDREILKHNAHVILKMEFIDGFLNFLKTGAQEDQPLILSYPTLDILRKLIELGSQGYQKVELESLFDKDSQLDLTPTLKEFKQVAAYSGLKISGGSIEIAGDVLSKIYLYQSILKSFDFSHFLDD